MEGRQRGLGTAGAERMKECSNYWDERLSGAGRKLGICIRLYVYSTALGSTGKGMQFITRDWSHAFAGGQPSEHELYE